MSAIALVPHTSEGVPATHPPGSRRRADVRPDSRPYQIVVRIEGEADVTAVDALTYALGYAANRVQHAVVVDLRNTCFLSIRAAATLATAQQTCRTAGVELHFVTGPRCIERVLRLAGVPADGRFHSTVRAALRA